MCPRCDSLKAEAVAESPVKGAWTVYSCPICFYTWRSTEADQFTDPSKYEPSFKVRQDDIPNAIQVPAVPKKALG
ncbi:non-oxidative hydroxyarylic acid decarboxylases subunit D [Alicyclobacillus fastidiosus]